MTSINQFPAVVVGKRRVGFPLGRAHPTRLIMLSNLAGDGEDAASSSWGNLKLAADHLDAPIAARNPLPASAGGQFLPAQMPPLRAGKRAATGSGREHSWLVAAHRKAVPA